MLLDSLKGIFTSKNSERLSGQAWGAQLWYGAPLVGKYSDVYFYSIINKIFNALKNCRFVDNSDTPFVTDVKDFLDAEIIHLVWNYWKDGIIVVEYSDRTYKVIDKYRKNSFGEVIVPTNKEWYILYSDLYLVKRTSTFDILKNELFFMDKLGSALDFLTSTYGSVCLISGNTMPVSDQEKEELNLQLKTSLGITADKNQFVISQSKDLKMDKIDFDVNGLALDEKIKDQYLLLADYFGVPKNILSLDTDSTYENQKAALKRFYSDCISPLCEIVLSVGRMIISRSNLLVPSTDLTFVFDNVADISTENEFVESVKNLLEIAKDESLSLDSREKLMDIINNKIENYQ